MTIIGILSIILVLGILIAFHELGHFLAAKAFNIGVKTFSIGFGPRILGFRRGLTDYRLSALPLGGFVNLVGETDDELPEGFTDEHLFSGRPAYQRMIVFAAGATFNFILAVIIYWGLFWANGINGREPVIAQVMPDTPAMEAQIQAGDKILAVDDTPVEFFSDVIQSVNLSGGKPVRFTLERNGERIIKDVIPKMITEKNAKGKEIKVLRIGIMSSDKAIHIPLGPFSAFGVAVAETWDRVVIIGKSLVMLISHQLPLDSVGGPIMIGQLVSEQAEHGLQALLALTAFISVNLGLFNLLPIPVLDGGHILFCAIETLLRRPVSERIQELTTKAGLAFLILLMLLATYNDLQRNFSWLSIY